MRAIYIIVLSVFACIATSCSNDDDAEMVEAQVQFPEIVGIWEWVGTTGGVAGTSETPETTGVTRDIVISETEFIFYVDDDILAQRAYTYTQEESTITGQHEFIVTFEDNGFRDIVRREDNFINFIDDCEDCFTSIYRLKD